MAEAGGLPHNLPHNKAILFLAGTRHRSYRKAVLAACKPELSSKPALSCTLCFPPGSAFSFPTLVAKSIQHAGRDPAHPPDPSLTKTVSACTAFARQEAGHRIKFIWLTVSKIKIVLAFKNQILQDLKETVMWHLFFLTYGGGKQEAGSQACCRYNIW